MASGNWVRRGTAVWTEEDDAILRELNAQGVTYAEIGRLIGRTTGSTEARRVKLKLPSRTEVLKGLASRE